MRVRGELSEEEGAPMVDAAETFDEVLGKEEPRSSRCTISSSLFLNANCSVLLPHAEEEPVRPITAPRGEEGTDNSSLWSRVAAPLSAVQGLLDALRPSV